MCFMLPIQRFASLAAVFLGGELSVQKGELTVEGPFSSNFTSFESS